MISIVPAVIPKSEEHLRATLASLAFSPEIHVDVVDGKFVPFVSWPYEPAGDPLSTKEETDKFTLEVDLMINNPTRLADVWLEAGADMLVFHVESVSVDDFARFVDNTKISVGISALNSTPLEKMEPYLRVADYVQLMGIAEIGTQGQPFDSRVLERIKIIKNDFANLPITIDGSINKNTIREVVEAGANRLITGSAVVLSDDPYSAYIELLNLANKQ